MSCGPRTGFTEMPNQETGDVRFSQVLVIGDVRFSQVLVTPKRPGIGDLAQFLPNPYAAECGTCAPRLRPNWQKGASWVHTDPAGRHDAELLSTARVHMIAGTSMAGPETTRAPVRASTRATRTARPRRCAALFVALEEWVRTGTAPAVKSRSVDCTRHGRCGEAVKMPTEPGAALPPRANPVRRLGSRDRPIDLLAGAIPLRPGTPSHRAARPRLPPPAECAGCETTWKTSSSCPWR
jgi:hypothetical protein